MVTEASPAVELNTSSVRYVPSSRPWRLTLMRQLPRPLALVLASVTVSQSVLLTTPVTERSPPPWLLRVRLATVSELPKLRVDEEAPSRGGISMLPPAADRAAVTALRALMMPQP